MHVRSLQQCVVCCFTEALAAAGTASDGSGSGNADAAKSGPNSATGEPRSAADSAAADATQTDKSTGSKVRAVKPFL